MELLIGCGADRTKKLHMGDPTWKNLVTLDINEDHEPDYVHDLEIFPYPFKHDAFDEIHAYEVLEHTGAQGDYRFFFNQFTEFWRILKPGGRFFGSVPKWDSLWAWSDPSHRRIISHGTLIFLSQKEYAKQVGKTPMSDFRSIYFADFDVEYTAYKGESLFFVLKAVK